MKQASLLLTFILLTGFLQADQTGDCTAGEQYCEQNSLDPSQVSSLISKSLKEKIQLEATNLRMLKIPKCGQLPI